MSAIQIHNIEVGRASHFCFLDFGLVLIPVNQSLMN